MYSRVAVVKPDHIGDLILAIPAIGAIASRVKETHLFVAAANVGLASFLFPSITVSDIRFDHLNKTVDGAPQGLRSVLAPLHEYELAVFLRYDAVLNRDNLSGYLRRLVLPAPSDHIHDSIIHRRSISQFFGDYDPEAFWPGPDKPIEPSARRIGLCIASGFPTNKWSVVQWARLATTLKKEQASELFLIGGPSERTELAIIARLAGIDDNHVMIGTQKFGSFLERVSALDLVIASDGGGGHLCSLAAPTITISASAPFRRYAPFGRHNRVVSMDLACSPCLNAHDQLLNACFSHECSYGIGVEDILSALVAPPAAPGFRRKLKHGAHLFYALSHVRGA